MRLVHKIHIWWPTCWGWLVVLVLLGALSAVGVFRLYPFLAQTAPLPQAELRIIEGWLGDAELVTALEGAGSNELFVATGGPVKYGGLLLEEKTYADITAARLRRLGIAPERIITAPAPDTAKDRTYVSALAVRKTLEEQGLFGRPANLYSPGAHSRRSFLLYRFAFGPEAPLGIISLKNEDLDLSRWWQSSRGFKHVLTELISWLYVQCTRWKYDGEFHLSEVPNP